MLKKRLLTALVAIPLVLLLVFKATDKIFLAVTAILTCLAAWEWTSLMKLKQWWLRGIYVAILVVIGYLASQLIGTSTVIFTNAIWWFVALLLVLYYPDISSFWQRPVTIGIVGILIFYPFWLALILLRNVPFGPLGLLFVLVLVWACDSAAYFAGRCFGQHKLIPNVSPGKTWEGFTAAIVAALIMAIVGLSLFANLLPTMGLRLLFALGVVAVGLIAVVGDLFESMIKRQVGVKDSGQWLPGHGGILDRLDSLLAAAPIFVTVLFGIGIIS